MTAPRSSRSPRPSRSSTRLTRPAWSADAIAAAAALGAHGAVLAILVGRGADRTPARDEPPLELSVSLDEPPSDDSIRDPAGVRDYTRPPEHSRLLAAARQPRGAETPTRAAAPEPALSSEAPWSPSWSLRAAPEQRIDLGLDGGIAWRPALHPDWTQDPGVEDGAEASDPGHLRGALDERDRALGLGNGGAVVAAVHDVARAVSAARDGAATIEVTTDAVGRVLAVRAVDVSSDVATWTETARAIGVALQGRRIVVPSGARGVVVSVRVEVAMRLPSGTRVGHAVAPMENTEGVGAGFDISEIGAHPRPVVHARVVAERRL